MEGEAFSRIGSKFAYQTFQPVREKRISLSINYIKRGKDCFSLQRKRRRSVGSAGTFSLRRGKKFQGEGKSSYTWPSRTGRKERKRVPVFRGGERLRKKGESPSATSPRGGRGATRSLCSLPTERGDQALAGKRKEEDMVCVV